MQTNDNTPSSAPDQSDFTRAEDAPQGSGSYGSGYGQADGDEVDDQLDDDAGLEESDTDPDEDEFDEDEEAFDTEEIDEEDTGTSRGPAY